MKKVYVRPEVRSRGDLRELTQGSDHSANGDTFLGFPLGSGDPGS